ncbi:DUF6980 family protein [Sphingomonas sp. Leaf20]|uniref:DUF6980 family protein n=1 Tax=Sphingomonas sp. Leaf20 TaxID=1735685 RepID=UPI0009E69B03
MLNGPYCCDWMASDLAHTCAMHPDRTDCPDAFITEMNGGFGLMVHDGGSSAIEIGFCPWCGISLPSMDR